MPTLGKNNIAPAIDNITIIFAIELLTIKGLKIMMPSKVNRRQEEKVQKRTAHQILNYQSQTR